MGEDGKDADVFAAMREGDILVHHPYDSFTTSVERFVRQAVADPDVLAIKQTVYRTSADSPLVPSLIEAAERGKQAVCMVELKARFDEQANITWAKKLEQAGVHVVYGIPALKTHVKCILVVRREGDGVRHYAHIGTGNYNPKTARIYTDLGIFTCDEDLGSDIAEMFNYLTGYARPSGYRKALIAPLNLAEEILAEIDRTIESHSPENPARIRMKMNSLLDSKSIQALYRASQAGVEVELNVRGICALKPGVPGVSENIKVVSVVGRFLEHSRIYSFERPGEEPCIYIGSADLMPRNLYNRVELVIPILDERIRAEMMDILDRSLADDMNAWDLDSDGGWHRRDGCERPLGPARADRAVCGARRRAGLRDGLADPVGVALAELGGASQELGDRSQLLGGEACRERSLPVLHQRRPDLAGLLVVARGDLDVHLAAVSLVAHPSDVSRLLQSVDDGSDRPGRQAGGARELTRGHPSARLDEVEAAQVGRADAELRGREGIEGALLARVRPIGRDELGDEFLFRIP